MKKSIEEDVLDDDRILALFYGGSIGEGNTDLYSDIDLRIVVDAEHIDEFVANKKIRPHAWGNVLFFEDANPFSSYTVIHYENFIKVDSFYYQPADLQPSVWLKNLEIVKDTDGLMAGIMEASQQRIYQPTIAEVEAWRTKFFAYLHETYRRAMRQEYNYALRCLDNMKLSMVTAWYMEKGIQPNTFGDWAHYEGGKSRLTAARQDLLAGWNGSRDAVGILAVAGNIAAEFETVHEVLCEKLKVDKDEEKVQRILELVL